MAPIGVVNRHSTTQEPDLDMQVVQNGKINGNLNISVSYTTIIQTISVLDMYISLIHHKSQYVERISLL